MPITPRIDEIPDMVVSEFFLALRNAWIQDSDRMAREIKEVIGSVPTSIMAHERERMGKLISAMESTRQVLTDELTARTLEAGTVEMTAYPVKFGEREQVPDTKTTHVLEEDGYTMTLAEYPGLDTTAWRESCQAEFRSAFLRGYRKTTQRLTVKKTGPDTIPIGPGPASIQ